MDIKSIPIVYLVRSFLAACTQQSVSTVVIYTSFEAGRASMRAASNTGPEGVQAALAALNKTDEAAVEAAAEVLYTFEETARLGPAAVPWQDTNDEFKADTRKLAAALLAAAHAASVAKLVEDNPPPRLIV
jgi:hypothetical protein